ncbi:MAG: TRAP transporter substrate-binding protein DctP [Alphaproteobacteria bacterium]|jgi:TRAP-type transport system periplasmic protein|nr:TRAP transporter substrate-binding protein DctP [Alphaproteobacteria bacterium]MBU1551470.1 TRAP transporter substrate-binding protein DctP [Alphaproteobacteria bacterium]MBU2334694.1 TRAP transporter substrate-binding protein DctP [Alphaproteobacteria bacterium]MBU2386416.1 TRAP transporter substrate-binding protein DctP [Alphaproteobacteria bacterium]
MKIYMRSLCASAVAVLMLAGPSQAETQWSLFTPFTTNDKPTQLYREFAADVAKATGGDLTIEVFSSGELPYKNTDILKALATEQIQMADLAIGPVAGDVPELTVFGLPFLCTTTDQFYDAIEVAIPTFNERLQGKFKVRALAGWTMPPQQIWLRDEISSIADLKGKKVRTWNKTQVQMLDLLGGSGVAITPAEVIPALQRGVVDGAVTAVIPAYDWKFYEVAKTGYMLNFTMTDQLIAVNDDAFEALPEETKKALAATAKAWQDKFRQAINAAASEAAQKLEAEGMTLVTPTSADFETARSATRVMWEEWAKANGQVGEKLLADVGAACGAEAQ